MLYVCSRCGAVHFFEVPPSGSHSGPCLTARWVPLNIEASARASEYTEAGGTISGIDVQVSVTVELAE